MSIAARLPRAPDFSPRCGISTASTAIAWRLYHGTEFAKGQVKDTNFETYTPLRIGDVPELDIESMEGVEAPVGLGGTVILRRRDSVTIPIRPVAVLEALASEKTGH